MSKCELFNKYEEAIKVLKNEIKFQEFREASDSLIMALKLAIEALEKQAFGDWTPGRYAWEVKNVKMLSEPREWEVEDETNN